MDVFTRATIWSETIPLVGRKDEAAHGKYRTKRVILEIYDGMQRAVESGQPYQALLDPPPADPRVAHSPEIRSSLGVKPRWRTFFKSKTLFLKKCFHSLLHL